MSIAGIFIAALLVGGIGLFVGVFLGISGEKFAVETDEREAAVCEALPGNNCGGCGYAGCAGLAAAIVKGEAEVSGCPVGGASAAEKIGAIMGVQVEKRARMTAVVRCAGTCAQAKTNYAYTGIRDCAMASQMQGGGPKSCSYGCCGFGTCVQACPFDAIHLVDGVAVIDKESCKACGKCLKACPKQLITLVPYDAPVHVRCSSKEKGKDVLSVCSAGCIGCMQCQKVCPEDAVVVEENLARILPEKCSGCGACAEKCPKKIIF